MKRAVWMTGLMAMVLMFVSAHGFARGWGRRGGVGYGFGLQAVAFLELSPEQRQKLVELRSVHIKGIAETRAQLEVKREEMRALWLADKLDQQAVLVKHAEMEVLRQELGKAHIQHRLAAMEMLTPSQRLKWITWRSTAGRGMFKAGYSPDCPGWGPGEGRGRGAGRGSGFGNGLWID